MSRRLPRGPLALVPLLLALAPWPVSAQPRGAAALHELVHGLTVTPRVLVIGAHPDDDDPLLLAWLARARHVDAAYLSLTRGEGGESFLAGASGVQLGALRTAESVRARRVEGTHQFFTRAYDFGWSRNASEAYAHWDHDTLLADVVRIVRAYRPQVIVVTSVEGDGNGQHEVAARVAAEAFEAAGDTARCGEEACGAAWTPLSLYRRGEGITIDASGYDAVLGRSLAELARASRASHRSQGLIGLFDSTQTVVHLARVATHADTAAAGEIFAGADTSFARLGAGAPGPLGDELAMYARVADSVSTGLDLAHPEASVAQLARAVRYASVARSQARWCGHAARDAAPAAPTFAARSGVGDAKAPCDARELDLDASIDLVRERAIGALLAAAGVSMEATATRELLATGDTLPVIVTITNGGARPITVGDVAASPLPHVPLMAVGLPPGRTLTLPGRVAGLGPIRPWWVWARAKGFFPATPTAPDGVEHPSTSPPEVTVAGITVPEEIRRPSDVRVTLTIAGTTFTTSAGPIVYHAASPELGLQDRPVGAVAPVTLAFEQGLEWVAAGKPIDRTLRVALRSHSTAPKSLALHVALAPSGVRIDSLPRVMLAPGEQRDVFVRLRGTLKADRHELAVVAQGGPGAAFFEGFRTAEYPHVPPVRLHRSSGLYLQAVDVTIPRRLVIGYVRGAADATEAALTQLGIPMRALTAEELVRADLSRFTTIVVGPRAYEVHPELAGQSQRLLDFARRGGTLVVLNGQHDPRRTTLLAYPIAQPPQPEHVLDPDAPVTAIEPRSRILDWPNRIGAADWGSWVGERALFVPGDADARYQRVVAMHDSMRPANRTAILVAPVGRGTYVYSAITFYQQIPGGVPGALRLFVNMLSAGCRPAGDGPARC